MLDELAQIGGGYQLDLRRHFRGRDDPDDGLDELGISGGDDVEGGLRFLVLVGGQELSEYVEEGSGGRLECEGVGVGLRDHSVEG